MQEIRCNAETCIQDLPDGCLVHIMRLIGNAPLPTRRPQMHEQITVLHPLQCALVSRHWRALANVAVRSLNVAPWRPSGLSVADAQYLGRRFAGLIALEIRPIGTQLSMSGEIILEFARHTPLLEQLDLNALVIASADSVVQAIATWTQLRRVNLWKFLCSCNSQVENVFGALRDLPSLEHLSFHYTKDNLVEVYGMVATLPNLTTLELGCSYVPPVPSSSRHLHVAQALCELVLFRCKGERLMDTLGLLTGLEALQVDSGGELRELTESLGCLSRLTRLEVINCFQLESLPSTLGQLSRLRTLRVQVVGQYGCQGRERGRILKCGSLRQWPESFGHLHSLETLDLTNCGVLPATVNPLTSLRNIQMKSGKGWPIGIAHLTNLRRLELKGDHSLYDSLNSVESTRLIHSNFHLQALDYASGRIWGGFQVGVGAATRLEGLKVSHCNGLLNLPEGVVRCQLLTRLEISHSRTLVALPEGLGQLSALRELRLMELSELCQLPQSLGSLRSLVLLDLFKCGKLVELPETLGNVQTLRVLRIRGCHISLNPLLLGMLSKVQVTQL